MKERTRIGVDTGGTFTDFVLLRNGKITIKKILSTPKNPALAIMEGIQGEHSSSSSLSVIHGTTVATNALLERRGGKIALVTTRGFEDVIFIGRQTRRHLYRLRGESRVPLLSRELCFGLDERMTNRGKIEKSLSLDDLRKICDRIQRSDTEAVAVCLLHSYANTYHEDLISKELKERRIMASVSSHILPEYREYERASVAVVNAYLMPVMSSYLDALEAGLEGAGLRIMQSNEGHISPAIAKAEPVRTALSGPAGGVVAAHRLGKAAGFQNLITFDMGGTSSDVSLVERQIRRTNESVVCGYPVRLPMIDIHTVGAGGGSIAFLDAGGALRVGPQSAGAEPGPACYGIGKKPTVTDANLLLGRLAPEFFLGGQMPLYPERSRLVLEKLARNLGKPLPEAAEGIIAIANANMEKAIRVISIERGFDPRKFALFSFGGAGGQHAAEIASHLKIKTVIIPKNAGVLSALGLLLADSIKDYSQSVLKESSQIKKGEIEGLFASLRRRSLKDMKKEGFRETDLTISAVLDIRYSGQSYEIAIPVHPGAFDLAACVKQFHRLHTKTYSYYHHSRPVEIVNLRVKALGRTQKMKVKSCPLGDPSPKKAFVKNQELVFKRKRHMASLFDRSLLAAGNAIEGPALVADCESTTFLPPGHSLTVDAFLNLIVRTPDEK